MIQISLLLLSFILVVFSMPYLIKTSIKHRLYDEPSGDGLKIHKKPIPYLGGIGMFLGFLIGIIGAYFYDTISLFQVAGLVFSGLIIIFLGLWDDFKWKKNGSPFLKLFFQLFSSFIIVFILIKIGINFNFSINAILLTIISAIYIVGSMNALNMQDGMDGLAGSITSVSLIGFIILALYTGNNFVILLAIILIGSVMGFLVYNWNPASIFMGDNGSHFLGFSLAMLSIIFTSHPFYNFNQFIGPILIIGLPIIDAGWAIVRRLINGKSPFLGDREHLSDKLLQMGFGVKKTVLICCLVQFVLVSLGLVIYIA